MTMTDELAALGELRAKGTLTEEEFVRAKARLLGGADTLEPINVEQVHQAVNQFRRTLNDRWIGGVCGGLARSTGMPSWIWRLIFTTIFLFAGAGFLLYVLLWIFVPSE